MKLSLKRTFIAAAIATSMVGLSAVAIAQSAAPTETTAQAQVQMPKTQRADKQGKHRVDRMERMQQHMAERQAQLKTELKLAPEQEAAWSAFVERTAPAPRMAKDDTRPQRGDWSKLTTPERLDNMQARHDERNQRMTQRIDATKRFYATLTTEQQKTFDSQSMRGFQRAGMKGKGMGHHGKGHGHHRGMGMGDQGNCSGPMMQKRS